jgi:hypothetical protein
VESDDLIAAVIPGRVEDANPESRADDLWIPGLVLRTIPE